MKYISIAAFLVLASAVVGCRMLQPSAEVNDALVVGVAAVDITPEEPIRLSGYGSRREPATGAAERLHVRALAFGDRNPAVLITADVVGVSSEITEEVARRLMEKKGIDRSSITLAVTHTHTGPQLRGVLPNLFGEPIPDEHRAVIDRYTDRLVDEFEAVAVAALEDRRPGRVSWSTGTLDFAANRRVLENGKWTGFGVNPDGPVDHSMPLLRVTNPDGSLRAVLLSYACHCTTLGPDFNEFHGDWAGFAAEEIERRHDGVTALVTIGCGADQNPEPRRDLDDVRSHGGAVADEVDRLLRGAAIPIETAPSTRLRNIEIDFAGVPTRSEWEEMAKGDGSSAYHAAEVLARGANEPQSFRYPVQTWTFGDDLAMVFLGGEVVVDYALRLREELDGDRIWIQAYSNDVMCYIASDRLLDEGGYEVDRSMHIYDQPSRIAYGSEDRIVSAVLELLPEGYHRFEGGE